MEKILFNKLQVLQPFRMATCSNRTCSLSMVFCVFLCLFISCFAHVGNAANSNFHDVLGIKSEASDEIIRGAYKQLIKQWHPDKSDHPDATRKFMEIQHAYEHLMGRKMANAYDGGVYNTGNQHLEKGLSFYRSIQITEEDFENKLLTDSMTQPILLVIYHEKCYRCAALADFYKSINRLCKRAGVQFHALNSRAYPLLVRKTGMLPYYPGLVLLLKEDFSTYQVNQPTMQDIVDFLIYELRRQVYIEEIVEFIDLEDFLWNMKTDGRVKTIIAAPYEQISLDYLVIAFAWRQYITFGYMPIADNTDNVTSSADSDSDSLRVRFQLESQKHTLLVFKEHDLKSPTTAAARLTYNNVSRELIWPFLRAHQYLDMPRLRSQRILEDLCPVSAFSNGTKLCALLISDDDLQYCEQFRNLSEIVVGGTHSVRKVYVQLSTQREFVQALLQQSINAKGHENFLAIVVIRRWNITELAAEEIHSIDWSNPAALERNITKAAKSLVNSCWHACQTLSVPRLRTEVQNGPFVSSLDLIVELMKDQTMPLFILFIVPVILFLLCQYFVPSSSQGSETESICIIISTGYFLIVIVKPIFLSAGEDVVEYVLIYIYSLRIPERATERILSPRPRGVLPYTGLRRRSVSRPRRCTQQSSQEQPQQQAGSISRPGNSKCGNSTSNCGNRNIQRVPRQPPRQPNVNGSVQFEELLVLVPLSLLVDLFPEIFHSRA